MSKHLFLVHSQNMTKSERMGEIFYIFSMILTCIVAGLMSALFKYLFQEGVFEEAEKEFIFQVSLLMYASGFISLVTGIAAYRAVLQYRNSL